MNATSSASMGSCTESGNSPPAKPKRYQAPTLVKSAVLSAIAAFSVPVNGGPIG
jgi:hypothetical protein